MGKKKIGMFKRQATVAEVKKAKTTAIEYVWAIFFSVMRNKYGFGKKRLQKLWFNISDLCESVSKGYVSINDLKKMLKEEMGIELK